MHIDHVIIGARKITEIRDLLRDTHGFGTVEGSAHADGTQGWLVPFDSPHVQYLELLTARDERLLLRQGFGRDFLDRTADGPAFLAWAVHSDDIERDAARLARLAGADPGLLSGESVRADGQRFPWTEAAFEMAWRSPARPFFLRYGNWPARRARLPGDLARAAHHRTPLRYAAVVVGTAEPRLARWWDGAALAVQQVPADTESVRSVRIDTADGAREVTLP